MPLSNLAEVSKNIARDVDGNPHRRVVPYGGVTSLWWYDNPAQTDFQFNSTKASGTPQFLSNIA